MKRKHSVDILFLLIAILVFLSSVFLVLSYGAGAYGAIRDLNAESGDQKFVLSFIATKIRQADQKDGLSVITFGGKDAICISEEFDGLYYNTLIYEYDGYLRELFYESSPSETPEEAGFSPTDGEALLKSGALNLSPVTPKLLRIELTHNDGVMRMYLGLKSEGQWLNG